MHSLGWRNVNASLLNNLESDKNWIRHKHHTQQPTVYCHSFCCQCSSRAIPGRSLPLEATHISIVRNDPYVIPLFARTIFSLLFSFVNKNVSCCDLLFSARALQRTIQEPPLYYTSTIPFVFLYAMAYACNIARNSFDMENKLYIMYCIILCLRTSVQWWSVIYAHRHTEWNMESGMNRNNVSVVPAIQYLYYTVHTYITIYTEYSSFFSITRIGLGEHRGAKNKGHDRRGWMMNA